MAEGNINSALNLLTNNMENGVLPLNKDTLSKLIQKHPKGKTTSKYPDIIYLFKVNNRNNRRKCEICSKLII